MNKDRFTKIMYLIIILMLIFMNLIIFRKQLFKDKIKETNNKVEKETVKKDISYNELKEQEYNKLVNDSQENRTKKYLAEFLDNINSDKILDIDKAYSQLNDNFRNKYFKNKNEFVNYINKNMKIKSFGIKYLDEKSHGDLFVEKVELFSTDNVNAKKIKTAFVIKETGYEEYTVSFDIDMINKSNIEE